jgi:acyl dehydratase
MADQTYWDDVEEGAEIALENEEMESQRLVVWAAASGDFYQIHFDDGFAKNNRLPDIIVHGALKGMLVGRLLDEWTGSDGRIVKWNVSYRGMDPARQALKIWGTVTKKYEEGGEGLIDLDVGVAQPDGTQTTPGTATVALPKK